MRFRVLNDGFLIMIENEDHQIEEGEFHAAILPHVIGNERYGFGPALVNRTKVILNLTNDGYPPFIVPTPAVSQGQQDSFMSQVEAASWRFERCILAIDQHNREEPRDIICRVAVEFSLFADFGGGDESMYRKALAQSLRSLQD